MSVSNNAVPVEDIIYMQNIENALTEAERYNARIWCHYTEWDLKMCLRNLNEVNNGFTWMENFTHVCRNMSKAGILI